MLKKLLLVLLAGLIVLAAGSALAQEDEIFEATGKLLWLGEFPDEPAQTPGVVERGSFASDVLAGLKAQKSSIDIKSHKLTKDQFTTAYWALLNDHPELFYVDHYISFNYSGGYVKNIYPQYLYSGADLTRRIAAFNATLDTIVSHAQQSTTQLGQMLLVNDYFCQEYQYDYSYSIYSPDQLFTQKTGVCQAYTLAYKAVLDRLGIVSTTAQSDSMNHIWNMVQLNGSWYHVDVTWNDPPWNYGAGHDYFLLSDSKIQAISHYGWVSSATAGSTVYDNAFWRNIGTAIPVVDNMFYYTQQDANAYDKENIIAWNSNDGSSMLLHSYKTSYWSSMGNPLAVDRTRIYYPVRNVLYSVSHSGGDQRTEHIVTDASKEIVAMSLKDGIITLVVGTGLWDENCTTVNLVVGTTLSISLPNAWEHITQGTQHQLILSYNVTPSSPIPFYWASSNESVATVYNGWVTAVAPGITKISAVHGNSLYAECQVVVHCPSVVGLPASVTAIGPETFENAQMQEVILPEGLAQIGERTFAGCTQLRMLMFLTDDVQIAANAFEGCSELFFLCRDGSTAQQYAQANGIEYQLLP